MNQQSNTNKNQEDDDRINVNIPEEVDYWVMKLKIPEHTLIKAVEGAGPQIQEVQKWLKNNGYSA